MTSRDMTAPELLAYNALGEGDLGPVAAILAQENADFHPFLQRRLARMMNGDQTSNDFEISAHKHKYIRNAHQGVRGELNTQQKGVEVAIAMAENGAFKPSCYLSALGEMVRASGLRETQVAKYWSEHKQFVRSCIHRGHVEIPMEYWPPDLMRPS